MGDFWRLARLLLVERKLFVLSVLFALIGAGGLGVGLLALQPIVKKVIDPQNKQNLPQMATEWNDAIGRVFPQGWIDALPSGQVEGVTVIVVALGVLAVFGAAANFLHAYFAMTVIGRTVVRIRNDVFRHVAHLPMRSIAVGGPSDYVSRIVYDTGQIGTGFSGILSKALSQILKGLCAVAAAVIADWRLTLSALPLAFVTYHIVRWTGKKVRRAAKGGLEAFGELYRTSAEVVQHLRVVKTSTAEEAEMARFAEVNMETFRQELRVRTMRSLASPVVEVLALFVLGALTVVAVHFILKGKLDPGDFIVVLGSLGIAGATMKPLTSLQHELQVAGAAANRIADVLRAPTEEQLGAAALPALARHRVAIEFRDVTFTYPGASVPALAGINLVIPQGETVAFVGPNGSGKTTLLALIPRLYAPDAGSVLVDDADIARVSLKSLRNQIGVVTQETVMFKGSLRMNVAYGFPGATDAQIEFAMRQARATEFIAAKTGGLDFLMGEQGTGLSGGQRQRIAIARAILRDPAILILDEATSMIDADSEAKIADALAEFSKGRTSLIVAHRLSTVVHAHRIVVMDHGRVVDVGRHDELMKRCETYRLIAQNQLFRDDRGDSKSEEGDGKIKDGDDKGMDPGRTAGEGEQQAKDNDDKGERGEDRNAAA
ncbi:ABC transporter ATP-binding protein [soil metagenome]